MYQTKVITDISTEPVTLSEAKTFLVIDFADFDTLITTLIKSARIASENVTGKAYGAKVIEVTGNDIVGLTKKVEKVYPVTPFVSDVVWADEDGNIDYRYNAGFTTLPEPYRTCILMRVATGFAYRQDGISEAVNRAINASIIQERQLVTALCV